MPFLQPRRVDSLMMKITVWFFSASVVLAVSLALGEGGTPRPPLNSTKDESEPIKVKMESLPGVQWTAIASQESPSSSDHEEMNRVDSDQEDALSSAASDQIPVDTANMLEVENISEDVIVRPTNLASALPGNEVTTDPELLEEAARPGVGLANVMQDLGMTESTILVYLGSDFQGDLNHMTFNEIMAALDEAKAWEEENGLRLGDDGWRVHTYPSEDKYLEKWDEKSVEEAQQEEEQFELWHYNQHFVLTFFICLLIVAALVIVAHQCYIERKLKRRAFLEMQTSALPVKEPVMQPMFVIVPQQLAGKQHLY